MSRSVSKHAEPKTPFARRSRGGAHRAPKEHEGSSWTPATRWSAVFAAVLMLLGGFTVASSSAATTPTSLWADSVVPTSPADPEVAKVELGTKFQVTLSGKVTALRYYHFATSIGPATGTLWDSRGKKLASVKFADVTTQGWQRAALTSPVSLRTGTTYVVSYTSGGHYAGDEYYFTSGSPYRSGPLVASTGVYRYGSGFPTSTYHNSSYYADVEFVVGTTSWTRGSTASPTPTSTTTTSPTASPTPTSTATASPTASPSPTSTATTSPTASPSPTSTTTTSPTASPSPTATSTTTATGCAAKPSSCGYPDATTTGVQPGVTLKRVPQDVSSGPGWHYDTRGWVSIDGDGATFAGYSVTDPIDVVANNVTISNVRSHIGGETWAIGLRHAQGVTISNVTISAPDLSANRLLVGIKDVYGDVDTLTVRKSDVSGTSTGIQVHAGLIEDNYVHDLGLKSGDHINGFTSNAGSMTLTIRHNTIFNQYGQTDAISLFQDFGPQRNRLITDNLLAGGGYTLYAGANPGMESTATNIVVTNNRFSAKFFPRGGSYGPYTAYTSGQGNVWSGNIWDESGATIL